jgi:SAM-dependent methyltransferase
LVDGLPQQLHGGLDVADLGLGSGHAVNVMAKTFPASRFTDFDFAEPAIGAAIEAAAALGVTNASFVTRDLAGLDLLDALDLVTVFDAIHDHQAQPARVLALPWASLYYTTSAMQCMTTSLADGGTGLGSMWGHQRATAMLADAGFREVEIREIAT